MTTERKQIIDKKISAEKAKSTEKINRLIEKEKDTTKLIDAISEEKANMEIRINQLKAQKRAIIVREQSNERKQRTRRLIQHGALAEKYFNCVGIATADFEELLKKIIAQLPTNFE